MNLLLGNGIWWLSVLTKEFWTILWPNLKAALLKELAIAGLILALYLS